MYYFFLSFLSGMPITHRLDFWVLSYISWMLCCVFPSILHLFPVFYNQCHNCYKCSCHVCEGLTEEILLPLSPPLFSNSLWVYSFKGLSSAILVVLEGSESRCMCATCHLYLKVKFKFHYLSKAYVVKGLN